MRGSGSASSATALVDGSVAIVGLQFRWVF
jgi:hypothetical protein